MGWSAPLCEFFDGHLVSAQTNHEKITLRLESRKKKVEFVEFDMAKFNTVVENALRRLGGELTNVSVDDTAVQPEGELMTPTVHTFIEKYS